MEAWRKVWRDGFARTMPVKGLQALSKALCEDDQRLLQGATTSPPSMMAVQDWPVEGACAVSYGGWQGEEDLTTVGDVEKFFAEQCFKVDQSLGEPAICRHFLNWFDETPRETMRKELLPEVQRALAMREEG